MQRAMTELKASPIGWRPRREEWARRYPVSRIRRLRKEWSVYNAVVVHARRRRTDMGGPSCLDDSVANFAPNDVLSNRPGLVGLRPTIPSSAVPKLGSIHVFRIPDFSFECVSSCVPLQALFEARSSSGGSRGWDGWPLRGFRRTGCYR